VESKVVAYSIRSVEHGADPDLFAVSMQVTLVINLVVGCHYFTPGPGPPLLFNVLMFHA